MASKLQCSSCSGLCNHAWLFNIELWDINVVIMAWKEEHLPTEHFSLAPNKQPVPWDQHWESVLSSLMWICFVHLQNILSDCKCFIGGKPASYFSAEWVLLSAELEFSFNLLTSISRLSAHRIGPRIPKWRLWCGVHLKSLPCSLSKSHCPVSLLEVIGDPAESVFRFLPLVEPMKVCFLASSKSLKHWRKR